MGMRKPAGVDDITLTDEDLARLPQDYVPSVDINGNPTMKESEYIKRFGNTISVPPSIVANDPMVTQGAAAIAKDTPPSSGGLAGLMDKLKTYGEFADTYSGAGPLRMPVMEGLEKLGAKVPARVEKSGRLAVPTYTDVLAANFPEKQNESTFDKWVRRAGVYGGGTAADVLTDPLTYTPAGLLGFAGKGAKALGLGTKAAATTAKYAPKYAPKLVELGAKAVPFAADLAFNLPSKLISMPMSKTAKEAFAHGYKRSNEAVRKLVTDAEGKGVRLTDAMLEQGYAGGPREKFLGNTKRILNDEAQAALESVPYSGVAKIDPSVAMKGAEDVVGNQLRITGNTPAGSKITDQVKYYLGTDPAKELEKKLQDEAERIFKHNTNAKKLFDEAKAATEHNAKRAEQLKMGMTDLVEKPIPKNVPAKMKPSKELSERLAEQKKYMASLPPESGGAHTFDKRNLVVPPNREVTPSSIIPNFMEGHGITPELAKERISNMMKYEMTDANFAANANAAKKLETDALLSGAGYLRDAYLAQVKKHGAKGAGDALEKANAAIRPFLSEGGKMANEVAVKGVSGKILGTGLRNLAPAVYQLSESRAARNVLGRAANQMNRDKSKKQGGQ